MKNQNKPGQASVKKPVVSPKMAKAALSLREKFLQLPQVQKSLVTHFFNLHNAAGCIYNDVLAQDARDYIDEQIKYSQELQMLEQAADAGVVIPEEGIDVS